MARGNSTAPTASVGATDQALEVLEDRQQLLLHLQIMLGSDVRESTWWTPLLTSQEARGGG